MDALKSQCLETSTLENEKVLIDMDTSMPGDFNAGRRESAEELIWTPQRCTARKY